MKGTNPNHQGQGRYRDSNHPESIPNYSSGTGNHNNKGKGYNKSNNDRLQATGQSTSRESSEASICYVLINLNEPIANCLRISVKTIVYTNVRLVVIGVVNLVTTRNIDLQVNHRFMSRHLTMNFLMGLIHKLKVQAHQQLIIILAFRKCFISTWKDWFPHALKK